MASSHRNTLQGFALALTLSVLIWLCSVADAASSNSINCGATPFTFATADATISYQHFTVAKTTDSRYVVVTALGNGYASASGYLGAGGLHPNLTDLTIDATFFTVQNKTAIRGNVPRSEILSRVTPLEGTLGTPQYSPVWTSDLGLPNFTVIGPVAYGNGRFLAIPHGIYLGINIQLPYIAFNVTATGEVVKQYAQLVSGEQRYRFIRDFAAFFIPAADKFVIALSLETGEINVYHGNALSSFARAANGTDDKDPSLDSTVAFRLASRIAVDVSGLVMVARIVVYREKNPSGSISSSNFDFFNSTYNMSLSVVTWDSTNETATVDEQNPVSPGSFPFSNEQALTMRLINLRQSATAGHFALFYTLRNRTTNRQSCVLNAIYTTDGGKVWTPPVIVGKLPLDWKCHEPGLELLPNFPSSTIPLVPLQVLYANDRWVLAMLDFRLPAARNIVILGPKGTDVPTAAQWAEALANPIVVSKYIPPDVMPLSYSFWVEYDSSSDSFLVFQPDFTSGKAVLNVELHNSTLSTVDCGTTLTLSPTKSVGSRAPCTSVVVILLVHFLGNLLFVW